MSCYNLRVTGTTMRNLYRMLNKAISIAVSAHAGQFDKGGKPYILHPLHLMNQLMYDTELAIIAVLHDVVEDSDVWTIGNLKDEGFSERVIHAIELLTHVEGESYQRYIDKIATNIDTITVKRKDLEHNSCITRLKGVSRKDLARMEKYHLAFIQLGEALSQFK